MKKSRFSESQIVSILKEVESGMKVDDVCRKHGISTATYYSWKSKYGGMQASDLKKLKELEEKKREMANIIEVSNSAYEARDAALQVRKNYGSERGERILTCSLSLSPPPSRFFRRPAGAHYLAEPG